jgi:hypothetical protein
LPGREHDAGAVDDNAELTKLAGPALDRCKPAAEPVRIEQQPLYATPMDANSAALSLNARFCPA